MNYITKLKIVADTISHSPWALQKLSFFMPKNEIFREKVFSFLGFESTAGALNKHNVHTRTHPQRVPPFPPSGHTLNSLYFLPKLFSSKKNSNLELLVYILVGSTVFFYWLWCLDNIFKKLNWTQSHLKFIQPKKTEERRS